MKRPDSISHLQAQKLLQRSLDGKLEPIASEELELHLQQCAECRQYAEKMQALDRQLSKSLQLRYPPKNVAASELAGALASLQLNWNQNKSKSRRGNAIRGVGWASLVILLIIGLAWTIKTLAPLPSAPAVANTPSATNPITQPTPEPSQSPQVISPIIESPAAGRWIATTDFGSLVLNIEAQPSRITRLDFMFSAWSCGAITQSLEIADASSWLFTDNQFVAYSTFDKDAQLTMEIKGAYDPQNQTLSGSWQEAAQGTTCSGTWEATPAPLANSVRPSVAGQFPGLEFHLQASLPSSPENLQVYRQQLSEEVTAESARQVATQWGVAGGVYSSPSEGAGDAIFDVMDGARSMRFLNFPDQFIYSVGYASPDYGSALMDSGPLPSFDEQMAIAKSFIEPLGILDLPYRTMPLETERGMVAFIPLLDGYPVIQEIGVDRSNIGWIDVKVSTPGQVTMVEYSHHNFQPLGEYPILTAQQAWDRFISDSGLQHSRYAVLSPEAENTYQSWMHKYQPGQTVDIYGWVNSYTPVDFNSPPLVMINNLPIIGDTSGLLTENPYDVNSVHVWGEIQGSQTDGIALRLAGWETSNLGEEYITGTLTTQSGQTLLSSMDRTFVLLDPPSDIPEKIQVGIQGVVLGGDPPQINWKFIETGQIPFSYGASSTCGGSGAGGGSSPDTNFGGGSFKHFKLSNHEAPATQENPPFQPGESFSAVSGRTYITQHLYFGGSSSLEVILTPDPSSGMDLNWGYSLIGNNLTGIEQYNNLPVKVWGQIDRIENHIVYINVDRFEPVYPGQQIQAWTGTEQIVSMDGQEAVLFTTSDGESFVIKSSLDYPPADANIIGRLGDMVEIEGYLMPDTQVGGYTVLQDTSGSVQLDGVADSAEINVWDHSQDPGSNPAIALQGKVTIESVELAYDAINLDRCQASAANNPDLAPWLVVQPMWVFNGHFEDGRRFFLQVQALPDEYLQ